VHGAGVVGLGLLAGCGRLPASAPPPTRVHHVGYLASEPAAPQHEAFRQALRDLGYLEGQKIASRQVV
jgi:hypothetical protein